MGLACCNNGMIYGLSGAYKNTLFKVAPVETLIIGRDPAFSNIVIGPESRRVSRRHCSVKYDSRNKIYEIINYSNNYVIINNSTCLPKNQRVNVHKGSVIEIGDSCNSFNLL